MANRLMRHDQPYHTADKIPNFDPNDMTQGTWAELTFWKAKGSVQQDPKLFRKEALKDL